MKKILYLVIIFFLFQVRSGLANLFDENSFALKIVSELKKTKKCAVVTYNKKNKEINCDGLKTYTTNIFQDYQNLPLENQHDFIVGLVQMLLDKLSTDSMSYIDAAPLLMPRVRERFHFEALKIYLKDKGAVKDEAEIPYVLLNDHLGVGLTLYTKNAIRTISKQDLKDWKIDFNVALKKAMENLHNLSEDTLFTEVYSGVWVSSWHDSYDPSRLLFSEMIRALKVKGETIAFLPNRDTLIIVGSEDTKGLRKAIELVYKGRENHRVANCMPFILRGEKLEEFKPSKDHPLYEDLCYLAKLSSQDQYEEQSSLLTPALENDNTMVSEYEIITPQQGEPFSLSVLLDGFITYLPESDKIALANGDDLEQSEEAFNSRLVNFEKFREVCGHIMEQTDDYPRRYIIKKFPNENELKSMGVK